MRLLRLDLLRYGHLGGVALDFPPEAPLTVVLGANEAGKSTALEAIGDALFGFPHASRRSFLHGARGLRIGFTLRAADGTVAAFRRRKGDKATLLDEAENPQPDTALAPFLGEATRELFRRSFGLDAAELRVGGEALLRSGGEAGQSLLAGLGLPDLRALQDGLEAEARSLHGDRRGPRRLNAALDAWKQARNALNDASVRPKDWEEAEAAQRGIEARLDAVRGELRALSAEAQRLRRIQRAAPTLARLEDVRGRLAAVADAPRLPADLAARLARAREAAREAGRDSARLADEILAQRARQAALVDDPEVLAVQDGIDALAERRPEVLRMEAEDLPPVLEEIAGYRAKAASAGATLDPAASPEALRATLPAAPIREQLRQARERRLKLLDDHRQKAEALADAERARAALLRALAEVGAPPSPLPLRHAIDVARGEGPVEREMAGANRTAAEARTAAQAALAAMRLWQGTADALAALPLPLPAEAEAAAQAMAAAAAGADAAGRALAELDAEAALREAEASRLAAGETVPTPAAVAEARAKRDAEWRGLRRRLEGSADPGPASADAFEALRDAADRLADRRAEEAQRVAEYTAATARLALLRDRRPAAVAALEGAGAAQDAAQAAWRALWAACGILPLDPMAMLEWRRAREEALRLDAAAREAERRRAELAERVAVARAALAAVLPEAASVATLAAALVLAEGRCAEAEAAAQAHAARRKRLEETEEQRVALQARLAEAAQALSATATGWAAMLASLGLAPAAEPEDLGGVLDAWNRIAEVAPAWAAAERRVAQMRAALAEFTGAAAGLAARLSVADPAQPPGLLVRGLQRRLAEARAVREAAARLAQDLDRHQAAAADAARRQQLAAAEIAALATQVGVAEPEALDTAIARAAERDRLMEAAAALEHDLAGQGDGRDEAGLRAEAAAIDLDALPARLREIAARQEELNGETEALGGERARGAQRLAAMAAGRDAAGHAQAAQDALAAAREAAERYARIHLARRLLAAGMERFRREQQSPLLQAAGAHFALLTGGRYARLLAEPDGPSGGMALHALRADGVECPVDALSEGTRDQLFLALRVAGVERLAAAGAVLPFIADDLLAPFDETRAAAALALLARLGRVTQVILFTHHAHVAVLARRQEGVAVATLPDATLAGVPGEDLVPV